MVMVTVDIPNEINKMIEHFKVEHELKDKRDAIVMLLKRCAITPEGENIEEMFKQVNEMKKINLSPKDFVKMKREAYIR